jgi:hypothetical protein
VRDFLRSSVTPQPLIERLDDGIATIALKVAMYSPARTAVRPPAIIRRPRNSPLSRFMGATPTSAAILWRLSRPRSGNSARIVDAVTGPMPGADRSRSSVSRQSGLD